MTQLNILKPEFDLSSDGSEENLPTRSFYNRGMKEMFKKIKSSTVVITDAEIEKMADAWVRGLSVNKHGHKADFLACWQAIKDRLEV